MSPSKKFEKLDGNLNEIIIRPKALDDEYSSYQVKQIKEHKNKSLTHKDEQRIKQ